MLARAGVVPLSGWISDYPMTPAIVGQLEESVAAAAKEGKLKLSPDEAVRRLHNLAGQLNLPTPAGPAESAVSQAPAEQQAPKPEQTVINNYYYNEGPPIVTYYPPPAPYAYLYAWVPFPSFWFGFWWPGFFIVHDFTTVVVVSNRPVIVSNRIIVDRFHKRFVTVDPIVRTKRGTVLPHTTIRTESGKTFRTVTELRKSGSFASRDAGKQVTSGSRAPETKGFRSPEARKGAWDIYSRSVQNMRSGASREGVIRGEKRRIAPSAPGPRMNSLNRQSGGVGREVAPSTPRKSFRGQSWSGERRDFAPGPRMNSLNRPSGGRESWQVVPGQPQRSFRGQPWSGKKQDLLPGPPVKRDRGSAGNRNFMRSFDRDNRRSGF
jgi:hypothetical protein